MRIFVRWEIFHQYFGDELPKARAHIGPLIEGLMHSGKMESHGVFVDGRAGFFVLNVDSETELLSLISPIIDLATFESHPVMDFETLGAFFKEQVSRA